MGEHIGEDFGGDRFERVSFLGARFRGCDFEGVTVRGADFSRARLHGVDLVDAVVDGDVSGLVVNGVEVGSLVEAELDRRHPERVKMRPTTADGFREAWRVLDRLWAGTVERARALDPALLHVRVDGEWSFTETLRHLVFATDTWARRVIGGDPRPWDALSLPFDEMTPHPEIPWDREARPDLDTVLALREDRRDGVRRLLDDLTDEDLAGRTEPVDGPGWPRAHHYPVAQALRIIVNEEWQHRLYAERDLARLEEQEV